MVLLVSYDLNRGERPSSNHAVHDVVKRNAASFKHALYVKWFVETDEDVQSWSDLVRSVAHEDDNWFVLRVAQPYQGWLPADIWEWLRPRI